MAQVNSTPGQNQAFGNVAVASTTSETGVTSTKAAANATVVPYTQSEPGKQPSPTNPVRK
jgi:hypothetical protein